MILTGDVRDEIARILEIVARDGLPGPRDLDVALDAIGCAIDDNNTEPPDDDAEFEWIGGKLLALPGWERDDGRCRIRLMMAVIDIPCAIIKHWSDEQCVAAEIYALSASYAASDNDVIVPVMPEHVKRYTQGGSR